MPLVKCPVEAGANINAETKVTRLIIYHPLIHSTLHRLTVLATRTLIQLCQRFKPNEIKFERLILWYNLNSLKT